MKGKPMGLSNSTIVVAKKGGPGTGTGFSLWLLYELIEEGIALLGISEAVQDWLMKGVLILLLAFAPLVARKARSWFGKPRERLMDRTNLFKG